MKFKSSQYKIISDVISGAENELAAKRILFSTRKGMGVTITNYALNLLQSNQFDAIPDQLFNVLLFHELIVPEDEDELNEVVTRKLLISKDDNQSELQILVGVDDQAPEDILLSLSKHLASLKTSGYKTVHFLIVGETFSELCKLFSLVEGFIASQENQSGVKFECSLSCSTAKDLFLHEFDSEHLVTRGIHLLINSFSHSDYTDHDISTIQEFCQNNEIKDIKKFIFIVLQKDASELISNWSEKLTVINGKKNTHVKIYQLNQTGPSGEKSFLKELSNAGFYLDLFPTPDNTYFGENPAFHLHPLRINGTYKIDKVLSDATFFTSDTSYFHKKKYNTSIVDELLGLKTKCASCVYLPMCGGRLGKSASHDEDCPGFITNAIDKAKLKYQLPL